MASERLRFGPPAGPDEQPAKAGDRAIGEAKAWRSLPRPVEDQPPLLDEHGFGHDGSHATGPGEPNDGRQDVQQKDGQLTRRGIVARSEQPREMLHNQHFAMHRR